MAYQDEYESGNEGYTGNWWEGPMPLMWVGEWPPALAPGESYGPSPGQINRVDGSTTGSAGPNPVTPPPTENPTQTPQPPPPGPPQPPGPGGGTLGGLLAPFQYGGTDYALPPPPEFVAPEYTPYEKFSDPTMDDARADPGYAFARDEGQRALEASKAAQGVYNTGGTLKDLIGWGNSFATQRYGDVRNRKMDTYLTNYKTQNIDPYEKLYRGAVDAFAPKMQAYGTEAAWKQHANDLNWSHAYDTFRDQRDSTFNKSFQYLTA